MDNLQKARAHAAGLNEALSGLTVVEGCLMARKGDCLARMANARRVNLFEEGQAYIIACNQAGVSSLTEIAKLSGISVVMLCKIRTVLKKGSQSTIKACAKGYISISKAYTDLLGRKKTKAREPKTLSLLFIKYQ